MAQVMRKLGSVLYTAYLFNQYDIISTIGPVIVVGCVLAGVPDAKSFFHGVVWQELHLIAFEIQNQITGIEEDKLSKPTRPLVSGRLTVQTAQRIYLALIVLSLWNSAGHGVLVPSILHLISMVAYNEFGLSRYWALKSFIGSMGYVCYCWGMTVIFDHGRPLSRTSIIAVVLSGLIFTTTGHAQDFRDREGDAAIGRRTLAIILPQTFARWSLMALIFGWSAGLIYLWGPPAVVSALFLGLAAYTTVNFVRDYSEEADRVSYWWYNIWLIVAHMLPLFKRLTESRVQIDLSL
ncbi:UbiA prenyltransferase family-domain-containing protein [Mycena metata]|uniref:UbiA prenyltransferase family-domain-containing protein n=1 Tax=Mycena metata TaxID=1033252 RepID=A0AAD7JEA0_9AGAR|nr:UbiA prenyltransferase family-domain-containing protein [Mycena metata]